MFLFALTFNKMSLSIRDILQLGCQGEWKMLRLCLFKHTTSGWFHFWFSSPFWLLFVLPCMVQELLVLVSIWLSTPIPFKIYFYFCSLFSRTCLCCFHWLLYRLCLLFLLLSVLHYPFAVVPVFFHISRLFHLFYSSSVQSHSQIVHFLYPFAFLWRICLSALTQCIFCGCIYRHKVQQSYTMCPWLFEC